MPEQITTERGTAARPAPAWSPVIVAYQWRARDYPWARRALAMAEAIHGAPSTAPSVAELRIDAAGKIIPEGLCQCGCGQRTTVAVKNERRYGHVKGRPLRFVTGHNPRPDAVPVVVREKPRCGRCGYLTTRCCCTPVVKHG